MGRSWFEVTKDSPCPICKKDHYCSISDDGRRVNCRFEPNGGTAARDRSGATYFKHRIANSARSVTRHTRSSAGQRQENRADPDEIHAAYAALLECPQLALSDVHRKSLEARGFSALRIDAEQYRTLPASNQARIAAKNWLLQKLGGHEAAARGPRA